MSLPLPLDALRARLATVAAPVAEGSALPTGIAPLDRVLRGGGLPRGRVTELVGARSSGRTTMLRRLVAETAERGLWVAYVDAGRTLAARDWARVRGEGGDEVWMIRPPSASRAAWCADVLLRSGAFGLVVLDGAPRLRAPVAVRLGRLARETGTALLVTADAEGGAGGGGAEAALPAAVRLRVARLPARRGAPGGMEGPALVERRRIAITVEKGGLRRKVEVCYDIGLASRLCAHPEVGDRRGGGGRGRGAETGRRGVVATRPVPDDARGGGIARHDGAGRAGRARERAGAGVG